MSDDAGELIPTDDPPDVTEAEQVEQVIRWMLDGNRETDVVASMLAAWPGKVPQPGKLIDLACIKITESASIPRQTVIGWSFESAMQVYQKAIAANDLAEALRTIRFILDMADRYGVDAPPAGESAA